MYRSCKGDRKESEYTHTAGRVDLQALDHPIGETNIIQQLLVHSTSKQDWAKYYEQTDTVTLTDVLDTDEARQTTSVWDQ